MAQIFASERSTTPAPVSKRQSQARLSSVPESALSGLQRQADQSGPTTRLTQLRALESAPVQRAMDEEELMQGKAMQRVEDEEMLQGKFIQRMEEEEALQGKAIGQAPQVQQGATHARDGLPVQLQQGVEALSGADLSQVNVHYNSAAPARVGAHAYAQGNNIHLASGQEKHLPHEAWHVAQQQLGRVAPTTSVDGVSVNDDAGLETEADVMGAKASQLYTR